MVGGHLLPWRRIAGNRFPDRPKTERFRPGCLCWADFRGFRSLVEKEGWNSPQFTDFSAAQPMDDSCAQL